MIQNNAEFAIENSILDVPSNIEKFKWNCIIINIYWQKFVLVSKTTRKSRRRVF